MNGKIRPSRLLQSPYIQIRAKVTMPGTTNGKPNIKEELKKNKVVRNIAIGATAIAIALFGYSCGARHTQVGQMVNPPSIQQTMLQETSQEFLNLLKQSEL